MACIKACVQALHKMCQVRQTMRAIERAKINAERERLGLPPLRPWYENICFTCCTGMKTATVDNCCSCCIYRRDRHTTKCKYRIFQDGTYPNSVMKSVAGFTIGILLSYIWYLVMFYQLLHGAYVSVVSCCIMGSVLSLGLAFSATCRCIGLLIFPSLCSKQGRMVLMTYLLVLVMSYPVANFRHNIQVMSDSATCGQEVAHNATKELVDKALAPVHGILNEIREVIADLVRFSERLRDAFVRVRDLFAEILAAIRRTFQWLGDMVDICNARMGQPYTKCKGAFDAAVNNCRRKLSIFKFLCEIPRAFSKICHVARVGELLCHITRSIKNFVATKISANLSLAINDVYEMFYFNVTLVYEYNLTVEQSRTFTEVKDDIQREIEARLQPFTTLTNFSNVIMIVMFIWLFLKAFLYRHKFLTKDGFDNCYISYYVRDIDERRTELAKETILPLNWKEKSKYIRTCSCRLTQSERRKLVIGLVVLFGTLLHGGFYMLCDYGLYWLLKMLRHHGHFDVNEEVPSHVRMHVQGDGILADIYRTLITKFDPLAKSLSTLDTTTCLPDPLKPNYYMYRLIGGLFGLSLFFVLFEAYGLRLRHQVVGRFHPERAKERAIWLYNQILQRRGGFLKHLRRQLRLDNQTSREKEKISLVSRLAAASPLLARLLRVLGYNQKHCLCCGIPGKQDDMEGFVQCDNNNCSAVYCHDCFADINNLCTACMNPVDYGDFSDFSEERDSSDDEDMAEIDTAKEIETKTKIHDIERMFQAFTRVENRTLTPESVDYSYQFARKSESELSDSDEDFTSIHRNTEIVSSEIFDDSETTDEESAFMPKGNHKQCLKSKLNISN